MRRFVVPAIIIVVTLLVISFFIGGMGSGSHFEITPTGTVR